MPELPLLQLITTAVLTVVGIVVSTAALIVAYRNNFGWKPILINRWAIEQPAGTFDLTFEFWNRQKYPIVVREISLVMKGAEMARLDDPTWRAGGNSIAQKSAETIAPTTFQTMKMGFTASMSGQRNYILTVRYYDPRRDTELLVTSRNTFFQAMSASELSILVGQFRRS